MKHNYGIKKCDYCDKEIPLINTLQQTRKRFCSRSCGAKFRNKERWGWNGSPYDANVSEKKWRMNNPEKVKQHAKTSREKIETKEWFRMYRTTEVYKWGSFKSRLKSRYGVTVEWLGEKFIEQQGKCAICFVDLHYTCWGDKSTSDPKGIHIDHDNETKQVRGLLCKTCNQGLGMFKHSINIINNSQNYLAMHN